MKRAHDIWRTRGGSTCPTTGLTGLQLHRFGRVGWPTGHIALYQFVTGKIFSSSAIASAYGDKRDTTSGIFDTLVVLTNRVEDDIGAAR